MRKELHASSEIKGRLIPFVQNGDYFFKKAMRAYQQRNLDKARQHLERAVKLEPEEVDYICQLAAVLAEIGEYEASNNWLTFVLDDLDPDLYECYFFLANNYAHMGLFQQAEKHANTYLANEPDGEFLEDAEELVELISFEQEETVPGEFGEESLIQEHEEARGAIESGRFTEAIELLENMTSVYTEFWPAYNNLALAYFYNEQYDDAIQVLDLVLTKNEGNLNAVCNLALFYDFLGQHVKRDVMVERLKNVYPIHVDHRYKLGSTLGFLDEHKLAYYWLRKVEVTRAEWNVPFYHWLAVSAFHLEQPEAAKRYWEKIKQLDATSEISSSHLEALDEGTLTVDRINYRLQAPRDVRDSVKKHDYRARMTHLMLLYTKRDPACASLLQSYCKSKDEPLLIKELSAYIALTLSGEEVSILDGDHVVTMKSYSDFPEHVTAGMRVIVELEQSYLSDTELHELISTVWLPCYVKLQRNKDFFQNSKGIAAAMLYMWKKLNAMEVSQTEVAKVFNISSSTVHAYRKKLTNLLAKRDL
ncbi:tetratricopeptide repeat protein [Guptibacillus algicola]|uniref:tetratricopeptide repeat protein n=1 Tax=Guptibacillus algicola TaxID=225844 RepID=UPI001CD48B11|nr:tetratricopeptide repeat protein [Alkalihalobacillus algicola]MCA0986806.1 tetratricopeptide repeat protein [Alkalihalobacillus algicola]